MLLQELRRALRQKPFNLRDIRTWNSPERRSSITGMVLTPIPIELYDLIFSFVIPCSDGESEESTLKRMKDLRSLSVVCRLFCAEILPLVFRSVVFQNTEETAVSRNQMSYVPFCASLKNGEIFAESLALQVRQCTIRDWIGASNLADFFWRVHVKALPKLINLTVIAISRTRITPPLLTIIRRLPHLKSLTLDGCDFQDISASNVQKLASRVKLKTFRLFFRQGDSPVVQPLAVEFFPVLKNLTEFCTDSPALMNILMELKETPPPLRTLVVLKVLDLALLNDFLYRLHNLESLTVDNVHTSETSSLTSAPAHLICFPRLPKLRELTCPPRLIANLSGAHNLSHLSFSTSMVYDADSVSHIRFLAAVRQWPEFAQSGSLLELSLPYTFAVAITEPIFVPQVSFRGLKKLTVVNEPSVLALRRTFDKQNQLSAFEIEANESFVKSLVDQLTDKDYFPKLICLLFVAYKGRDWKLQRESLSDELKLVEDSDSVY